MKPHKAIRAFKRFLREDAGTAAMETVIMAPFLFLGLTFSYEYYALLRQQSLQQKATYTIGDMLARETIVVDDAYIDNAKQLFDTLTPKTQDGQLRVSVLRYHYDPATQSGSYELRWSVLRNETGGLKALTQSDIDGAEDSLPQTVSGTDLVMVETRSSYTPVFTATGLSSGKQVATKIFMPLRFAPQLCFEHVCEPA